MPHSTRSTTPSRVIAAARALAVAHVSEPASIRSHSNTARVAPSDTASRSAVSAVGGPIESAHTSSAMFSAASSACRSAGLVIAQPRARSIVPSGRTPIGAPRDQAPA